MITEATPPPVRDRAQTFAKVGAIWGLVATMVMSGLLVQSTFHRDDPERSVFQAIAWAVTAVAPFVLALIALRLSYSRRVGVWLGAGIASLFGSWWLFSFYVIIVVPAPVFLLAAAAASARGWERPLRTLSMAAPVVVAAALALSATLILTAPRCWERRNGGAWVQVEAPVRGVPSGTSIEPSTAEISSGSSFGTTTGGASPPSFERMCSGNAPTPASIALPIVAWFGATAAVLLPSRREEPAA